MYNIHLVNYAVAVVSEVECDVGCIRFINGMVIKQNRFPRNVDNQAVGILKNDLCNPNSDKVQRHSDSVRLQHLCFVHWLGSYLLRSSAINAAYIRKIYTGIFQN